MLSATHNALQVDAWHVLYIFPLWRSLNKCPLIYSSQEMNFYLCGLGTCSLSQSLPPLWSLGPLEKHTHTNTLTHCACTNTYNLKTEITNVAMNTLTMYMFSYTAAWAVLADITWVWPVTYMRAGCIHCKTIWLPWYIYIMTHTRTFPIWSLNVSTAFPMMLIRSR